MDIVHTYINNMKIDPSNQDKICFADFWGLVGQATLGHNVTLVCFGNQKKRREYFWKNVKIIELPTFLQINETSRIPIGLFKELLNIKADIFHSHHYGSFVAEITAIVGKIKKTPTYVTIHSTFKEGGFIKKLLSFGYVCFFNIFSPLYSRIFFISNKIKNDTYFSLIRESRKKTIYNYVPHPPKIKCNKRKDSILFIGRLMYQKGVDILIKSLVKIKKLYPNITLTIIGDGPLKYGEKLKKIIRENHLERNVSFVGKKFGIEKWKEYYSHNILVIPSRDEGFGNVVIEGMLSKIPVIISDQGALSETSSGLAPCFNIDNVSSLSFLIIDLLKDELRRDKLIKEGYDYAVKFTENRISKETISFYKGDQN
jgi:glycosyltransferase involved in cell wall biosynthesis